MEALVTLVFFKIKSSNLASWGILMQIFQKGIYFQIESFYDVIVGIFQGPVIFAIFEGISSEFGKVVYFGTFIKFPVFHKYYFIS